MIYLESIWKKQVIVIFHIIISLQNLLPWVLEGTQSSYGIVMIMNYHITMLQNQEISWSGLVMVM